jgi:hypothetical protein
MLVLARRGKNNKYHLLLFPLVLLELSGNITENFGGAYKIITTQGKKRLEIQN